MAKAPVGRHPRLGRPQGAGLEMTTAVDYLDFFSCSREKAQNQTQRHRLRSKSKTAQHPLIDSPPLQRRDEQSGHGCNGRLG